LDFEDKPHRNASPIMSAEYTMNRKNISSNSQLSLSSILMTCMHCFIRTLKNILLNLVMRSVVVKK